MFYVVCMRMCALVDAHSYTAPHTTAILYTPTEDRSHHTTQTRSELLSPEALTRAVAASGRIRAPSGRVPYPCIPGRMCTRISCTGSTRRRAMQASSVFRSRRGRHHAPLMLLTSPRRAKVVYAFFFFAEPLALFSWAGAAADVSAVDALLANSVPFRNLPRSTPAANHAINISHVVGLAMFS